MNATEQATAQVTPEASAAQTQNPAPAETQAKAPEAPATALTGAGQPNTQPEKAAETAESVSKVPEKYELKTPEGSPITPDQIEKIALIAKERGLSNSEAQAMVERDHMLISQHNEMVSKWKTDVLSDPELGGDNAKEKVELAHRAFKHFASEKFAQELIASGYGDHPELVRAFYKVGKMMGEDKFVVPGANTGSTMSLEDKFYGKLG